ncbi:MAG: substrate binding domain-containing protein [Aliivibrio sp.]|uniref:substrate binding domain-containing protein n=1 Tax=Aliivibrio sp. TaxID=1872443 RepID=UPI001A38EC31|nr:substrate binding domain-containing protein [Aliivibrio sp.]
MLELIQVGELVNSSLVARTINFSDRVIVASPEYLENYGHITKPEDLKAPHQQIKVLNAIKVPTFHLTQANKSVKLDLPYRLRVNTITACKSACLDGLGVASLPEFMCREHIKNGSLIELLSDWQQQQVAISLVYQQRKLIPKRLRAFIEHVLERFNHSHHHH